MRQITVGKFSNAYLRLLKIDLANQTPPDLFNASVLFSRVDVHQRRVINAE